MTNPILKVLSFLTLKGEKHSYGYTPNQGDELAGIIANKEGFIQTTHLGDMNQALPVLGELRIPGLEMINKKGLFIIKTPK
jgi:hypothetical protein